MVSFANPEQAEIAAECAHSFALDNGAFSAWKKGRGVDVEGYARWVRFWRPHPGFDFALIPDTIDGTEADNQRLMEEFFGHIHDRGDLVPVWHFHESIERLLRLATVFPRIALGSSGAWPTPNTVTWWERASEALDAVTDLGGHPITKLHGLRMMNPTIFARIPFASVDSTRVARAVGEEAMWHEPFALRSRASRALLWARRIEQFPSASRWGTQSGGL
jgi:hypothetical protein